MSVATLPGNALHSSSCRRLQLFFQYVRLDQGLAARLIVRILNYDCAKYLALDGPSWKFGAQEINILVLALATRRFRAPLLWRQPGRAGNSDTKQRIDLPTRYPALFGASSIKLLLAEREFIGGQWQGYLEGTRAELAFAAARAQKGGARHHRRQHS